MPKRGATRLRVHGGEARGRRLLAPAGIRPTQGLVKEAIFNILGDAVPGATAIDLFSGSGALGIEALSRGAQQVTFVDVDGSSVSILRRNLESLGYAPRARVVRGDATRWLSANTDSVAQAGLIFLDPPYGRGLLGPALSALDRAAVPGAVVVVEHRAADSLPGLARLHVQRRRDYGDTAITLYRVP